MTTKFPSNAPAPRTDDERKLVPLLEEGEVRLEFLEAVMEVMKGVLETRQAAKTALAQTKQERATNRVSFAEAISLLEGKIDLQQLKSEAIKAHTRYGLVDMLITKGVIENAAQYEALFDNVTLYKADLLKICEGIERGEKFIAIFDPGNLTPDELFKVLFPNEGVLRSRPGRPGEVFRGGYKDLTSLRRITPENFAYLSTLHEKSREQQIDAFRWAYNNAGPISVMGSRIVFTPEKRDTTEHKASATRDLQLAAQGEKAVLDPNADFIRFRTQLDNDVRESMGMLEVEFDVLCGRNFNSINYKRQLYEGDEGSAIVYESRYPALYEEFLKIIDGQVDFDHLSGDAYRILLRKAYDGYASFHREEMEKQATHYSNYVFPSGQPFYLDFDYAYGINIQDDHPAGNIRPNIISSAQQYLRSRIALG